MHGRIRHESTGEWRVHAFHAAAALALLMAAVCVYAGRLSGPFLFDDQQAIVDNVTLRSLTSSAVLSPPPETPVAARPLVNLSFAVDYALAGLSPYAFHRTNALLHWACSWLLFLTLLQTLRAPSMPKRTREHAGLCALLAALAFCLHPLATEVVLYTSQRSEALVALFYLLTFYLLSLQATQPPRSRARWLPVLLVALLGIASKEVFATAPLVALCFDRAFFAGSFRVALRVRRPFYVAMSAALIPLALLQSSNPRPDSVRFAELDYLLAQVKIVPRYLAVAVWPDRLALDYGPLWPHALAPAWPWQLMAALVLAACAWLAIARPRLGFLAVWMFAILAPSSSLFSIHTELGAERRFYLPLAGLLAYAAVGCIEIARSQWRQRLVTGLLICALLALGIRARARSADFASVRSAWQSAVRARPENARAHYNLAETYRREGDDTRAAASFEAAIAAHEAYADAHANLAGLLLAHGQLAPALMHARRATQLAPTDTQKRMNYGIALGLSGDAAGAVRELNAALRLAPTSVEVRAKLAIALMMAGRAEHRSEPARLLLSRAASDP